MMIKLNFYLIVFLLLLNVNVNSQSSEQSDSKVKFGVGIDIELFDFDHYPHFLAPSLKLSIEIADAIRIEPGFGFRKGKTESDPDEYTSDYKRNQLGLGVYWVNRSKSVTPVLGIYSDYSRFTYQYGDVNNSRNEEGYEFRIGPSLGIEYIISDHFSIGGDFLLLKSKSEYMHEDDYGEDETKSSGFSTGSNLRFRFYF